MSPVSDDANRPVPPPPPTPRELARRSLALDDEALMAECEVDVYVASGPGGQHRNKTESGVRLHHGPTKIVVTATERRSQLQNRGVAIERLRERLTALSFVPKVRRPTRKSRGAQQRRLTTKKKQSETKSNRQRPHHD